MIRIMKVEHVWTQDGLRLMGVHYEGKDVCIVAIHGMAGNFIENYFATKLGERLSAEGYGFIYGHNRGYSHVNDIATKPLNTDDNGWDYTRVGQVYELFEDSPKDVAVWVEKAQKLGYKKIILLGHSLGCNKVIYYLYKNLGVEVAGVVLVSPPDMVGSVEIEKYSENHNKFLMQARELVQAGKPREVLDGKIWDWYEISAQTYLSLFERSGPADNLPVLRNPDEFEQLASIKQPILGIMGEHDDIEIRNLKDDIELIKSKATASSDFIVQFVEGANHSYENRENELASVVVNWLKQFWPIF